MVPGVRTITPTPGLLFPWSIRSGADTRSQFIRQFEQSYPVDWFRQHMRFTALGSGQNIRSIGRKENRLKVGVYGAQRFKHRYPALIL